MIRELRDLTAEEVAILEKHAASVILEWAGGIDPVMVVRRKYYGMETSRAGGPWAIFYDGRCMGRDGTWEWEPMPSGRTDAFLKRCRFDTLREAIDFWRPKDIRLP